ncbi:MAG: sigma-E factor negative regulatory protein [Pseudomonadota bacterium]
MNDGINMQISAFVDGELSDNEAQLLLRRLSQDASLRKQAAEYLALGRAMRREHRLEIAGDLRGRIAAALDDGTAVEVDDYVEPAAKRVVRPLVGFAIAATVAIAALVGLQQVSVDPTDVPIATTEPQTVPDYYFERHDRANSEFDTRRVSSPVDHVEIEVPSGASSDEVDDEPVDPVPPTP